MSTFKIHAVKMRLFSIIVHMIKIENLVLQVEGKPNISRQVYYFELPLGAGIHVCTSQIFLNAFQRIKMTQLMRIPTVD